MLDPLVPIRNILSRRPYFDKYGHNAVGAATAAFGPVGISSTVSGRISSLPQPQPMPIKVQQQPIKVQQPAAWVSKDTSKPYYGQTVTSTATGKITPEEKPQTVVIKPASTNFYQWPSSKPSVPTQIATGISTAAGKISSPVVVAASSPIIKAAASGVSTAYTNFARDAQSRIASQKGAELIRKPGSPELYPAPQGPREVRFVPLQKEGRQTYWDTHHYSMKIPGGGQLYTMTPNLPMSRGFFDKYYKTQVAKEALPLVVGQKIGNIPLPSVRPATAEEAWNRMPLWQKGPSSQATGQIQKTPLITMPREMSKDTTKPLVMTNRLARLKDVI